MYGYIVFGFSCLCTCVHAEQCHPLVKAKRETFYVPLGENHLLSCVVVHCGENNWTWSWSKTSSNESTTVSTKRHHLTNQTLSASETLLRLQINNFTKSDEGGYGCKVQWKSGSSSQGHQSQVLFRVLPPTDLRPRRMWHRMVVCMSAVVCVPTLLVLARCLSSAGPKLVQTPANLNMMARYQRVPRPPPRRPVPQPHKASSKPKERHNPSEEVMYADMVHGALREPRVIQEPSVSTIYSSLRHDAM